MKRILYKYGFLAATASLLLAGCKDESWDPGLERTDEYGTLSFSNFAVAVDGDESTVSRATTTDVKEFTVEITQNGQIVLEQQYGSLPSTVSLKTGEYTVRAYNGEEELAAFEAPFYQGSQNFSIQNNMVTEVETIKCKLSNIKVTIKFSEALKEYVTTDCQVVVAVNNNASLTYTLNDINNARPGYFKAVDGASTMVATLTGTIDGESVTHEMPVSDVAPGQHHIITYSIKGPDGEIPDPSGSINPGSGITINVNVETVDHTFNADGEEDETIGGIVRPGDDDNTDNQGGQQPGDSEDPTPGPGDDDNPSVPVATFTNAPGSSLNINGMNNYNDFGEDKAKAILRIGCPNGFAHIYVKIVSKYLTKDFLESVHIADEFDLVEPGDNKDGLLDLEFPVENDVLGKNEIDFSITTLAPLIGVGVMTGDITPSDIHDFIITVVDSQGKQASQTLSFKGE